MVRTSYIDSPRYVLGSVLHFLVFCVMFLRFVYLRPVSCVPNVASFSGLFILDCRFCFLQCLYFLGTPVSSTNKTDHHDLTDILLKVMLSTIILLNSIHQSMTQVMGTYSQLNLATSH
jgi:hypothetical protein